MSLHNIFHCLVGSKETSFNYYSLVNESQISEPRLLLRVTNKYLLISFFLLFPVFLIYHQVAMSKYTHAGKHDRESKKIS